MKEPMQKRYSDLLHKVVNFVERAVASVLLVVIVALLLRLVADYARILYHGESFAFRDFLLRALDLVIGIEFCRMLFSCCKSTVIDVLMFATARQAIMDHSSIMENLLAVLAIAILFAVHKYIVHGAGGEPPKESGTEFSLEESDSYLTAEGPAPVSSEAVPND